MGQVKDPSDDKVTYSVISLVLRGFHSPCFFLLQENVVSSAEEK